MRFCPKLESYGPPSAGMGEYWTFPLTEIHGPPEHLKEVCFDGGVGGLISFSSGVKSLRTQLCELMITKDIKARGMNSVFLGCWNTSLLKKIAPQIVSINMEDFLTQADDRDDLRGCVFPNAETLRFYKHKGLTTSNLNGSVRRFRGLRFPERFPAVKRLDIGDLGHRQGDKIQHMIWTLLPNLEEIVFNDDSSCYLGDHHFIGPDGTSTFLQLNSELRYFNGIQRVQ